MRSHYRIVNSVHQFRPERPAKAASGYRMRAKNKNEGEIYLYGLIGRDFWGDGISAKQFADDLKALGNVSRIDLRINSDGGFVDDARAMYNLLRDHKATIAVHIDGIAASAASFIAMAGNTIEIAEGGFVMIHNARMGVVGEARDLRQAADILDMVNGTIRDTYVARTRQSAEQVTAWMDAETWFTGTEAVKHGFADKIVENLAAAAAISDPSRFKNLPTALRPNRAKAAGALAAIARARELLPA